jgi:hypothetical protein
MPDFLGQIMRELHLDGYQAYVMISEDAQLGLVSRPEKRAAGDWRTPLNG